MELLDWFFIILLSLAILSLVFFVGFMIFSIHIGNNIRSMKKIRLKNKRKRKKQLRQRRELEKKRKKQIRLVTTFLVCTLVFGSGALYSRYYQATNLGKKDSDAIVQGYYLMNEIQGQLEQVETTENEVKLQKNLYDLSARLASYGAREANGRLSDEGKILLNRLYTNMKELGLNMANQSIETLRNKGVLEGYLADIKKAKENQAKVFTYFNVNENALKQKQ